MKRKILLWVTTLFLVCSHCGNVRTFCLVGEEEEKVVYLTFDDGPSEITKDILKVLDEFGVKGTFFVIGSRVLENDNIIRMMYQGGHTIGNHTYSHDESKIYRSEIELLEEIYKTERVIRYVVPQYSDKIFRFPYGSFKHKKYQKAVEDIGYTHYNWHLDAGDSGDYIPLPYEIFTNIMKDVKYNKSVVLFHDSAGRKTTPAALRMVIKEFLQRGYAIKPLKQGEIQSF